MGVLPETEAEGDFQRNLTCLNSIVHMLNSIPEVAEVFEDQSYKSENRITDICDEIHRVLKLNTDAADLRVALGSQSAEDPDMLFAKQQNYEVVFFRYVYEAVRAELKESSQEIRKVWDKFTSGRLNINFVEISERSTDSVGQYLNKKFTPEMLPDFLLLKIVRKASSTNELKLSSENRIQMKNGDLYRLTCIIDKNRRLGTYSTTQSYDGAWSREVKGRRRYFAEADVKTESNYAYLYVKQKPSMVLKKELKVKVEVDRMKNKHFCRVNGCPEDLGFPTEMLLQDHMNQEHQSCPICGKQFLLRILHKEHVIHCHPIKIKTERKRSRRPTDPDSGVESLMDEDCPTFKPKQKWLEKFVEETKVNNDAEEKPCDKDGCFEIGRHWCFHSVGP